MMIRLSPVFSTLKRVLADNVDIPQPLFQGTEVEFTYDVVQDPGADPTFFVDRESIELKLPELTAQEARGLPEEFRLNTVQEVEDIFGRQGRIRFEFSVKIKDLEEKQNGNVRLLYEAEAGEIKDVTKE